MSNMLFWLSLQSFNKKENTKERMEGSDRMRLKLKTIYKLLQFIWIQIFMDFLHFLLAWGWIFNTWSIKKVVWKWRTKQLHASHILSFSVMKWCSCMLLACVQMFEEICCSASSGRDLRRWNHSWTGSDGIWTSSLFCTLWVCHCCQRINVSYQSS